MGNLLTRKEAAARLRIGLRTLDRRLATGELQCYRHGDGPRSRIVISEQQLQEYLDRHLSSSVKDRAQAILSRV